ncbi:tape measure protein [Thalassolituus oleivorans]|uniref:tape measure protein n=1 Tax=Thalassolituus oleivorans TaxID=187493 RepID=UPI0023F04002|nr:tape measure protein [Thalassolituus oleivorans]
MANRDLELALKIKATAEGLGEIRSTIKELENAGIETETWKDAVNELDDTLAEVARNDALIEQFVKLKTETTQSADALKQAQAQAQKLAVELKNTENPTKAQTAAFEKSRAAVVKSSTAYNQNRLAVQNMRVDLKTAGIETRNLAAHQIAGNKAAADAKAKADLLTRGLQSQVTQLKAASTATVKQAASQTEISKTAKTASSQLADLQRNAIALFGVTKGTQLIGDLARMADEYTNLSARVKLAVGEGAAFEQGMKDIRDTANDVGGALSSVGELYVTLNRATRELNYSQQQVADLTDTISKSFLVSGSSAQAADAAITQLAQGLQSGVLRGDEFNSVMEQSPRLAQAMTDALGVTRGELRAMAEDGKLTTELVLNALQSQSAAIAEEAAKMPDTIGRAMQRVQNEFMVAIGEMDQAVGASALVAEALSGVAANMETVIDMLELAGEVATAALLKKYVPAVVASSTAMLAAAKNGTLFAGSMTAVGASATRAGTAMGFLKGNLALAAFVFAIDQVGKLAFKLIELSDAAEDLKKSEAALNDMNAELVKAYGDISEKTGIVVNNMRDLDAALAAGTIVIDAQTNAYLNAAQAAELKAKRDLEASTAAEKMTYTQQELSARMSETNTLLQAAVDDNSKLASVMSGALLDAMKNGETGIAAFAIALRSAEQQGKLTAEQIETGLSSALAGLSNEERLRFGDAIKAAMGKVTEGADGAGLSITQLQSLIDKMNTSADEQALSRLGLSMTDLTGGISAGVQQSLADLQVLDTKLADLGVTGSAAAAVVEISITTALRNAKTEADRTALTAVLERWREQGTITAAAFDRITGSLNQTKQAADSLDKRMADLGIVSQSALNSVAESARQLYDDIKNSNAPIEDQKAAFERYAQAAVAANKNVADGQRQTVIEQLKVMAVMNGMSDYLDELLQQQGLLGDAGEQSGEQIKKGVEGATEATKNLSSATKESTRDVQAVAASLAEWFVAVRSEMSALSEQAGALFDDKMGLQSSGTVNEVDALKAALSAAHEELGKIAIDNIQVFDPTGVNRWKNSVLQAKNETVSAYNEQKLKFLEYTEALQNGDTLNASFIRNAETSISNMKLLGSQDLATLRNAIDSATQKLESMREAAKATRDSLQDELDRINGNQANIDKNEYERKKAEAQKELENARLYGDQQAINYWTEALKLLDQVRSAKAQKAREDAASSNAQAGSGAASTQTQSTSKTYDVNVNFGGEKTKLAFANEASADSFLSLMNDFKNRSGG